MEVLTYFFSHHHQSLFPFDSQILKNQKDHLYGVQFHPESILTEGGFRLLANFLVTAGISVDDAIVNELDRSVVAQAGSSNTPPDIVENRVVTF